MLSYEIKKYQTELKKQLLQVWENSVLATHHFLKPEDFTEIKLMLVDFDFNQIDVFCLFENQIMIGFIGVHHAKIEMLFLDPNYINKGLGLMLMNYVITNFNIAFVDVNEQNLKALEFYQKIGFEIFDRSEKDDMGKNYPILKMKFLKH